MFCKISQFNTSRRGTTRGRTAGNGVFTLKDVILKNIVCVNIASIKRIFSNQSHYFPDIPCTPTLWNGFISLFPNHCDISSRKAIDEISKPYKYVTKLLSYNFFVLISEDVDSCEIRGSNSGVAEGTVFWEVSVCREFSS